ncbi:MAG TPA: hypothetical protein DCE18_20565, partial [Syntrophobacteraceae bacterium]|nr:hypothetical protein [Syntrophobacteraceae bacterium]
MGYCIPNQSRRVGPPTSVAGLAGQCAGYAASSDVESLSRRCFGSLYQDFPGSKERSGMAPSIQELFGGFIDGCPEPWTVLDLDFRIAMANASFAAQHQQTVPDLIGKTCYQVLHHRDSKCEVCRADEVFRTGQPKTWEECRAVEGKSRFFEMRCYPVKDSNGKILHAVQFGHDITDRKHKDDDTKASEESYRAIVQKAREGIFVLDTQGMVIFANDRLLEMLAYQPAEILGQSFFELMDRDALAKAKIERSPRGLVNVHEMSFRCRSGDLLVTRLSVSSLMHDGAFVGSVEIFGDIPRVGGVEVELRTAKEFSERIINSITDNLVVIDPKSYHIVQANNHFLARVGREPTTVLNKTCYEIMLGRV